MNAEKSYHIENCKIRIFDDSKFVNTNEVTKITEISDTPNVNLATPQLHDYLVTGTCIGTDIRMALLKRGSRVKGKGKGSRV